MEVLKRDWGERGLTAEALERELVGIDAALGGRPCRLQLYAPDNPDLFAGQDSAPLACLWRRLVGGAAGQTVAVEVLHLGGTGLGPDAAHALAAALRESGAGGTLTKLWLKRNPLTLAGAADVLRAAAVADNSPRLTSLDFFNTQLGPQAAHAFAELLSANEKIKHLFLGGNRFGPAGGRAMSQLLCNGSMLTRLSLDISHLGDEGARSMAVALTQNTSLEYLCLKYNGFTPQGVACLFDALQENSRSQLETLILGWKLSYDELARKDGVPVDEIRSLANHVGGQHGEGVDALSRLLQSPHCSLTHLNLCRTFLVPNELAVIADALQRNSSLRQLHLYPQSDDADTRKEERGIADRVRNELAERGREHRPRAPKSQAQHRPLPAAAAVPREPVTSAVERQPAMGMNELRRRKKEITEELRILVEEGKSEEQAAERKLDLKEELARIADAVQRNKALVEAARKVLRKQKKKQRKEDAKHNADSTL